jgi:Fur family transcriptional regulator, ferric uptake regulator
VLGRAASPRPGVRGAGTTLSDMSTDLHATVDEQLRRSRQRYTAGRRQLVELLAGTARPVTIPELLTLGAAQSQSSLYRNLAVLEQCGAVHRMTSTDDVSRYELTEALSEHHHHFVCSVCGHIEDVTLPAEVERTLTLAAERAAAEHGYAIESHRFELVGRCPGCV